jgi:hypothetical protein
MGIVRRILQPFCPALFGHWRSLYCHCIIVASPCSTRRPLAPKKAAYSVEPDKVSQIYPLFKTAIAKRVPCANAQTNWVASREKQCNINNLERL